MIDCKKRIYPSKLIKGEVDNTDFNQYAYDLNGNMTWERKRNAAQIYYYYDNNNRLRLKDYANNSQTADIYYKYDSRGITLHSRFGSHTGEGIINTADGFLQYYSHRYYHGWYTHTQIHL
ncbi:MAG: hypothetical protein IPK77_11725 [Cellvibrio sp.]|nr:hypothetical protein [Cellvibrio sp.]